MIIINIKLYLKIKDVIFNTVQYCTLPVKSFFIFFIFIGYREKKKLYH